MLKSFTKAIHDVEAIIAVILFVVLLFNQELGKRLLLWEGIDPRWAWVPIGLVFLHLFLKAIYDNYRDLGRRKDEEIDELRAQLNKSSTGRTVLEKHRAREQWRGRIDGLVKAAPRSGRNKAAAQNWRDEVTVAFDNLLVDPAERKKRFLELTEGIRTGKDVKEAIRKGVQFLRDIRDTIKEGDLGN